MIELPFLADEGYTERLTTRGYLRQTPMALQQTISITLLDHVANDTGRVVKATVRSEQDLLYVLDTIGLCFGFSTAEYAASIKKAIDVYLVLFTPPLIDQLRIFEDQATRERCLLHAVRQLTLLFECRYDHPNGSVPHVQLIARLVDHLSKIFAASNDTLTASTWSALLRVCLGAFHYACNTPQLMTECRLTIGSIVFEALIRSRTRDASVWRLFNEKLPNTYAAVAQWSVAVVALTRAVASVSTRRALPPCVPLAWKGIIEPTRHVSNIVSYTRDDVVHLWKKVCVMVNPLRLLHVESLNAVTEAIRDSTLILATASYWPCAMLAEGCSDPNAELGVCSRHIPLGLATSSLLRLWGDALLHIGLGSSAKVLRVPLSEFDVSRVRAVEGLCAAFFRRETELACPSDYWNCFARLMDELCDGASTIVRGHLMLNVCQMFLHDLPWPYAVVRKMCLYACEVLAELADSGVPQLDEDDEEGAAAKPSGLTEEEEADERVTAAVQEALEMQRTAIVVTVNAAVVALEYKDFVAVEAALTALELAQERYQHVTNIYQRAICGATHIVQHVLRSENSTAALLEVATGKLEGLIRKGLDLLEAPCGAYDAISLMVGLRAVVWNADAMSDACVTDSVIKITTFCVATRRMVDAATSDGDVVTLCSLFAVAVEVLCALLASSKAAAIRGSAACHFGLVNVIEAGFQSLKRAQLLTIREAAHRLLGAMETTWWYPMVDGCSAVSSWVTEKHLAGIASSIQCFALGSGRIVTLAQLDRAAVAASPAASEWCADTDVVMLVRNRFGRRAWLITKDASPRPEADTSQLASPRAVSMAGSFRDAASGMEPLSLDGAATASSPCGQADALRYVDSQPRTAAILQHWTSSGDIAQIMNAVAAACSSACQTLDGCAAPAAAAFSIEDPERWASLLSRQWTHDVGAPFHRMKELEFDKSMIAALKGIDTLLERRHISVDVLYIFDDSETAGGTLHSLTAFEGFCRALGWLPQDEAFARDLEVSATSSDDPEVRVFASPNDEVCFSIRRVSAEAFAAAEDAAEAKAVGGVAAKQQAVRCRILWDSTSSRVDWTATETSAHQLLRQTVCPSMRRSQHTRYFDVIIRPLLQAALYAVILNRPEFVPAEDNNPGLWGGPLLHNTLATAAALPEMVRHVVLHGVCDAYTSTCVNPRCLALLQLLHDLPVLGPAQALVACLM